jgi:hypothetical protein
VIRYFCGYCGYCGATPPRGGVPGRLAETAELAGSGPRRNTAGAFAIAN